MRTVSPTAEGFRTIFRRPSFALGEIAWRWVFGSGAALLIGFSFYEFLRTLPVSGGDLIFLRTRHPLLISQAIAHILAGSSRRFVDAIIILTPCLGLLWIAAASLGRSATLRPLLEYFQTEAQGRDERQWKLSLWHGAEGKPTLPSLVGLNFLRLVLTLAAIIALFGAAMLAGFVSSKADPNGGLAFLTFFVFASLVGMIWSGLNWFLSLAAIFVVRDAQDTFSSLSTSLNFFGKHTGAVIWSSTVFGAVHIVVFVVASSVVFVPTMFLGIVPPGFVLVGVLALTILYFAVVDFLYMGRLAAYVCILECPPAVTSSSAISSAPIAVSGLPPNPGGALVGSVGTFQAVRAIEGDVYTGRLFPPPDAEAPTSPATAEAHHQEAFPSSEPLPPSPISLPPIPPSDDDILSDRPGTE